MPQPMGFGATPSSSQEQKLLLIASIAQAEKVDGLADYVSGADAFLLPIHELSSVNHVLPLETSGDSNIDIPWGNWFPSTARSDIVKTEIKHLMKIGCDFLVFSATNTPLAIPQDAKVGKILQIEASLDDGLLRAINDLPIDAVLLASEREEGYFLTWHHLMLFQHFANLLTKPLLASIPSKVTAEELQFLWEAGVKGVSASVGPKYPTVALNKLRQTIDKLTFPTPRKRSKAEALLPYINGEGKTVTETERDDEE